MEEIIKKLSEVTTMPELDSMREEVAAIMCGEDSTKETFESVQTAFRKAKNRLQRVPVKDRTW